MKYKRVFKEWAKIQRKTKQLNAAVFSNAMRMEPTPQFPGVDIDRVHEKVNK